MSTVVQCGDRKNTFLGLHTSLPNIRKCVVLANESMGVRWHRWA
jgi:hypothetical protein